MFEGAPDVTKSWEVEMIKESNDARRFDYIVVGAGAAGSVLAAELSASGAQVLVIESGGPDEAPTILDPASGSTMSAARSIPPAYRPLAAIEQSPVQYGPWPRAWRRH
jgi:choline dehydrogenase-like flavoprotein